MKKPANIDPLAEKLLERLSRRPESSEIVLGGYFALQHYLDYRGTYDIDAWWKDRRSEITVTAVSEEAAQLAREEGLEIESREFGDTISFELSHAGKKRFTFQIAVRSVQIEEPIPSPWPPVLIETLVDNVGAKMNALVNRGAPRDFLDIAALVRAGLVNTPQCWDYWKRKNPSMEITDALEKVRLQLAGLESRRPLNGIVDPAARQSAAETRDWFRSQFLKS